MNFVPICKLCLVKVENDQRQQILCEDTVKMMTKMITDVFQDSVSVQSYLFVYLFF